MTGLGVRTENLTVRFSGVPAVLVDELTADLAVLAEQRLGGTKSTTVLGDLDDSLLAKARSGGLEIGPVGLQELFVHLTGSTSAKESNR